jgi:hypothetical protein
MRRTLSAGAVAVVTATLIPAPVAAHGLSGLYDAPLPLVVYLAGAAAAVGLSFVFALLSSGSWTPRPLEPTRTLPRPVVLALKAVGLVAWGWIIVQLVVGGSSSAEVASLFTWVYGWVGLAIVCAILGPVWSWLDPFATLHEIGSWVASRVGLAGRGHAAYPPAAAAWPAVGLFVLIVWLELAYLRANMGLVVLGYTVVALGGMTVYGRDIWRRHGEVFSVWFGLLGRLALYAPAGPPGSRLVRRQHFPDGLLGRRWDRSLVTLVALSVAAILYDGLSQTQPFYDLFGLPAIAGSTVLLLGFIAIVASLALLLTRSVGDVAVGAGLLPISVGYLIAHYLTFLLGDGQRIVISASDPLQLGWDLFGTAFYEPSVSWLAPSLVWTVMFVAVVGGHVLGAWAGHLGAVRETRDATHVRRDQVPLALLMVGLTTLTLWSLGQNVIAAQEDAPAVGDVTWSTTTAGIPEAIGSP